MDFSTWLNQELKVQGWTNSELARRINVVPSTVSMWLTGQKKPSAENCINIAKELNVSPENVLRIAGIMPSIPPEAQAEGELLYIFRQLDEDTQAMIVAMMRGLIATRSGEKL